MSLGSIPASSHAARIACSASRSVPWPASSPRRPYADRPIPTTQARSRRLPSVIVPPSPSSENDVPPPTSGFPTQTAFLSDLSEETPSVLENLNERARQRAANRRNGGSVAGGCWRGGSCLSN